MPVVGPSKHQEGDVFVKKDLPWVVDDNLWMAKLKNFLTDFVISLAGCIIGHKVNGFVASHSFEYHSITISSLFSTTIFRIEDCWYIWRGKTSSYEQLQPSSHKLKFSSMSPSLWALQVCGQFVLLMVIGCFLRSKAQATCQSCVVIDAAVWYIVDSFGNRLPAYQSLVTGCLPELCCLVTAWWIPAPRCLVLGLL